MDFMAVREFRRNSPFLQRMPQSLQVNIFEILQKFEIILVSLIVKYRIRAEIENYNYILDKKCQVEPKFQNDSSILN